MKHKRFNTNKPGEGSLSFKSWAQSANPLPRLSASRFLDNLTPRTLAAAQREARELSAENQMVAKFCTLASQATSSAELEWSFINSLTLPEFQAAHPEGDFSALDDAPDPDALALWLRTLRPVQLQFIWQEYGSRLPMPLEEISFHLRTNLEHVRQVEDFFTLILRAKSLQEVEAGIALITPSN